MPEPKARMGDTVRVHYTGRIADGQVFDSSRGKEPFTFKLGEDPVVPGFAAAVIGMRPGERKLVRIPPEQAYGKPKPDLVTEVARADLPAGLEPTPGESLTLKSGSRIVDVTVQDVRPETIVLDANHALAGKVLEFDLELVAIEDMSRP